MPNILTNVLGGIQNVAKGLLPSLPVDYDTAPPANRDITVAYAPLVRKLADGTKVPVGSFLPEHYVLANAGTLRCQILETEWKAQAAAKKLPTTVAALKKDRPDLYKALYREENKKAVRKSAFELAICPSHKQRTIELCIEKEYLFRRDRDLPLPAMVSKFRVGPDYLAHINEAGLELKEYPGNCKINIVNPTPTRREKMLHTAGMYLSYLVTISASIAMLEVMMLMGVTSPAILALGVVGTYLAKKTGNDFGLYDVAETVFRDVGYLTNKDLIKGKFSLFNAIGTGIYMAAIGSAVFFAVTATWGTTLALPWALLAVKTGMGAGAIAAAQTAFAGLFAGVAGLGTLTGTAFTIRYFWGLSIYDNQIQVDKKVADALPVIKTKKVETPLAKQQDKLLAKLVKPKYGLTEKERDVLAKDMNVAFSGWNKRLGAHQPRPATGPSPTAENAQAKRSPRHAAG